MDYDRTTFDIREGMDIVGSDGEKIGTVDHFEGDYMVVKQGFFSSDTYIPVSAVAQADADQVYLNVAKDDALNQGWDTQPGSLGGSTTTVETTNQPVGGTDVGYVETGTSGILEQDSQPFQHDQDSQRTHVNADDDIRVELAEEELTAQRRTVDRGDVRVQKEVVAEEQTLDVPVTEERVNISRHSVDRDVAPGETTFQEETIEVPVHGEEVDVRKEARVREEVEISKEAVQGTERVTDTVRREEIEIDDNTAVSTDDASSTSRGQNRNS
jgi:uncharacterized protein (TIGR02271 family)